MYVYELALELDLRSAELVEAAARTGLGNLTPSSELTAGQVGQLRAALGRAPTPSVVPAPLPAPPPPPASQGPGPSVPWNASASSVSTDRPTSYFHRWLQWRMMLAAIVLPLVIVVGLARIALSDHDEEAAACRVPGNTMCRDGSLIAGGSRGDSGAGFSFGSSAEGDAEVFDRSSFCAAQERIRGFWTGLDQQLAAPQAAPSTGRLPVADWILEQKEALRTDVSLLRSSLSYDVIRSDETTTIDEATESLRTEVVDHISAPDVIGVRASSAELLDPALAELARVGDAHC